ncbi:MAG TPA: flavin reductase family protein [Chromatiales bacterium]|nr:flavin reductase family protein [Chromatiales bacterium]
MKTELPLADVYAVLEPGPVVLLSTSIDGVANVMTMSWHTMMEFEPPLVGCVISEANHSFAALRETGECVINVPTVDLAEKVVACGNASGRSMDKFQAFGLTARAAARVAAPLVEECYANLECRVMDRQLVATYNFFVLEVVKAWKDPAVTRPETLHHRGYGRFMVAGREIELDSKMR